MKCVKPTKHMRSTMAVHTEHLHTHSRVQIEKHVQQNTVSGMNFSFALFEQLLFTICSVKTHSLQVCYFHSALNTASILTKQWVLCLFHFLHSSSEDGQGIFSKGMAGLLFTLELLDLKYGLLHCRLWACSWHGIYRCLWMFQRAVEKTMPFLRSIKGVISYILLSLLLLFKKNSHEVHL